MVSEQDFLRYFKEYLDGELSRVSKNPNANQTFKSFNHFSFQGLSPILKQIAQAYHIEWYEKLYSSEEAREFWDLVDQGYLYFHDLDKTFVPYCVATSTSWVANFGRPYGILHSVPPPRSSSFISQIIEYAMDLAQDFAGAVALGDLFVQYATFSVREKLTDKTIENDFQRVVHVLNNSFRVGGDAPFTNVSLFDRPLLRETFKITDTDLIEEIIRVQKIYGGFIAKKDPKSGFPYRFPITTVNLHFKDGEFQDKDFYQWFTSIGQEGLFNIYITEDFGKLASCCRLMNDVKLMTQLLSVDSFGNGGVNIGSHRVITLNLYKIIKDSKNLEHLFNLASKGLIAHRKLMKHLIDKRFLKFFNPLQWFDLDQMFFSTVGFIGAFEACDGDVEKMAGLLKTLRDLSMKMAVKFRAPINLEQVPGETAAIKLAKGTPHQILSNQYIPLWVDEDLFTRIELAGRFDQLVTGGAITHLSVGNGMDSKQFKQLVDFAAQRGARHFAVNPVFYKCVNGHASRGKTSVCGVCGGEIDEMMTRIVGYFAPISSWNPKRQEEFERRIWS